MSHLIRIYLSILTVEGGPLKVLITGTVAVGKTQLLDQFEQLHIRRTVVLPNVAKQLIKHFSSENHLLAFQDAVFAEQIENEISAEKEHPKVILCHRGVLDVMAYAELYGHPLRQEWKAWTRSEYDQVIFLTEDEKSKDTPQKTFYSEVAKKIRNQIVNTGLPFQTLHYPSWCEDRRQRNLKINLLSLLF